MKRKGITAKNAKNAEKQEAAAHRSDIEVVRFAGRLVLERMRELESA